MLDELYAKADELEYTMQSYQDAFIFGDNSFGQLNKAYGLVCSQYHAVLSQISELEKSDS